MQTPRWRGVAAMHHGLMIRAREEVRPEPAREDLFELQFLNARDLHFPAGPGVVHGLAVGVRGQRDVVGVLVAAFDLQRGHADSTISGIWRSDEQIAGREQIAGVAQRFDAAIHDQFVGQPASLRALAAIGAAAAPGLRGEALPGVGDAQRAVNEDLQLAIGLRGDRADLVERQFAGQRHAPQSEARGQAYALQRR